MVPNHFHFIFGLQKQRKPFHLMHYLCLESCRQVNHPEEINFYYHYKPFGKYWEHIKEKVTPLRVELPAFVRSHRYGIKNRHSRKYRYAHYSDFLRLDKLIEHGGIYADMDTIFVSKIPKRLFAMPFVLGREGKIVCQRTGQLMPSLCNAFIMSEQGSEFAIRWRKGMEKAFDGTWSRHSTLLPQKLSEAYPNLIHIEPMNTFYKHQWTQEGIRILLEGLDSDYSGVTSMHLWSHLWWAKSRRDFTDFHSGLLTEAFIREVDTTYNLVARKYLPGLE